MNVQVVPAPMKCTSVGVQKTMGLKRAGMCSPPDSIPVLQQFMRLTEAKKAIEVGVFTGASTHPLNSTPSCMQAHHRPVPPDEIMQLALL